LKEEDKEENHKVERTVIPEKSNKIYRERLVEPAAIAFFSSDCDPAQVQTKNKTPFKNLDFLKLIFWFVPGSIPASSSLWIHPYISFLYLNAL
jgi:hypothetical protein